MKTIELVREDGKLRFFGFIRMVILTLSVAGSMGLVISAKMGLYGALTFWVSLAPFAAIFLLLYMVVRWYVDSGSRATKTASVEKVSKRTGLLEKDATLIVVTLVYVLLSGTFGYRSLVAIVLEKATP